MIKRFCDACGKEVISTANRGKFKHEFKIRGNTVIVEVDAMVAINGTINGGEICAPCIIVTVKDGTFESTRC